MGSAGSLHELGISLQEMKEKADAYTADTQRRAQESIQREAEAREREANIQRREEARLSVEQARRDLELVKRRCEELEIREKEAKEKEEEARRLGEEFKQAALDAQKREGDLKAKVLETQKREAEARMAAHGARKREAEMEEDLQETKFYLERIIRPEVWPTKAEFQSAKNRIQYDLHKLHFAVCGSSRAGKSSLVNALRGLKNSNLQAAPAGVVETINTIRYPDSRKEMPYNHFVWFDCPDTGTPINIPGWQYFNQQGLFIFDIVVLVYDTHLTEIDMSIIQNCERFNIPLFIIHSRADAHIRNNMQDLGYDEDDDDEDAKEQYQLQAQRLLIDTTKNNLEANLGNAGLAKHDVFIVSSSIVYSLVTNRGKKTKSAIAIDEARLIEAVLKTALVRIAHRSSQSLIMR